MNLTGYKDLKKLAEGHERVVYSALRDDGFPVVLKTLRAEHPSPDSIALMYHEFEVVKNLDLPGVIKVYELLDQQNQYVLVQENIQGISLQEYLQKNPIKELSQFFKLARQMASILGELHQQHVIHKDIKPANFIIQPETLLIKLTDFNFSSQLLHELQSILPPSKLEGTLVYMAPEQTGRMNMNIDYRVDFYALGVTFYEMLCGKPPFVYEDPLELIHAHLANPAPDITSPWINIPLVLSEIIKKLMSKNPSDRYQNSIGLQADLERCELELKNKGKIENFSLGKSDIFDRLNLSQKLYGREEEAKILLSSYDRTSNGAVEALMISGYSGIGKTMLVNEVHKLMVRDKAYFISGKFDQLQRNKPYTAITQAFNQLARLILAEPETRFESIKKALLGALGSVGQVIMDLSPDMELVLGPQPPLEKLPVQETQNRMMIFFKRFLQVVANQDHPLLLFIDDLQWIDSGSLQLFEYILTDEELSHVLLIGAYRDNEVDERHALKLFFNNMQAKGKIIRSLSLSPLSKANFEAFFKDSFNREEDSDIKLFAELIHKRTNGNPFFCKQIIDTLYKEKLLYFDYDNHRWDWKLEEIEQLNITENVVDFMVGKISQLPKETQQLLQSAACIGNRFTSEMLKLTTGLSADAIGKAIWPALKQELILTERLGYKHVATTGDKKLDLSISKDITYQFVHDRVQQAFYQNISKEGKEKTHLNIARILLQGESKSGEKERLFEIIDHFNEAHRLLKPDEVLEVINLNYLAGLQAQNANAYQAMSAYFEFALSLMNESWWNDNYELIFKVNREYALSLFLLGKIEQADKLLEGLLKRARTLLDKVSIYRLQIMNEGRQGRYEELFLTSQRALNLLGIKFKAHPSKVDVLLKLILVKWRFRKFHVEKIESELPELTDPKLIAAFDLLAELIYPAKFGSSLLLPYVMMLSGSLLLKYGKPINAGLWLGGYGLIDLNTSWKIASALSYMEAAKRVLDERTRKQGYALFNLSMGALFNNLINHPDTSEKYFQLAVQAGRESGEIVWMASSAAGRAYSILSRANSLKNLISAFKMSVEAYQNAKLAGVETYELWHLFSEILAGEVELNYEKLKALADSVEKGKVLFLKASGQMGLSFYYYFIEDFGKAVHYHYLWYANQAVILFQPGSGEIKALNGLTLIKCLPSASCKIKLKYQKSLKSIVQEIKWLSELMPGNFLHHYLFLVGEQEHLKGRYHEALSAFNKAIENAKKGNFYLWVALGNELAANLLVEQEGTKCALAYIREAHYYYLRYGMMVKVKSLEKLYPACFADTPGVSADVSVQHSASTHTNTHSISISAALDFNSLIKASQAISGEIVLEKLFEKMLHIVVENAGAESAFFLEKNKNTWMATARLSRQQDQEKFEMLNMPLKEFENLPQNLIQYALRSEEAVVLANASEDHQYGQDPYILLAHPKSILTLPLLHQNKVVGLLYLENNLTTGAFTQDRITVLTTLASQIAISLENSHYFQRMEHLYRSTERFVPKKFLEILNKENIEEVALGDCIKRDISVLFTDMRNFTSILEKKTPEEAFNFVNHYWEYMAPIIRKNSGYIGQYQGDAILALFPRQAEDAVRSGLDMLNALKKFNELESARGLQLDMGIGINSGSAMLGIIGEKERLEPAVISDVTNTAARVESLNKYYGTHFLLSNSSFDALKNKENYNIRVIDKVRLKGKSVTTYLYEIIDWGSELKEVNLFDYLKLFSEAFADYEKGNFPLARDKLLTCLKNRPNDHVVQLLCDRCDEFLQHGTPPGWDGVYTLMHK